MAHLREAHETRVLGPLFAESVDGLERSPACLRLANYLVQNSGRRDGIPTKKKMEHDTKETVRRRFGGPSSCYEFSSIRRRRSRAFPIPHPRFDMSSASMDCSSQTTSAKTYKQRPVGSTAIKGIQKPKCGSYLETIDAGSYRMTPSFYP